jgi:transcriptional regulator with XRE-family HTH domain
MRRAWRTRDFRAVFHLACQLGLTPETISSNTGLPLDLVLNVMNGNTVIGGNPGLMVQVAAGFGMPDDFRRFVGLAPPAAGTDSVPREVTAGSKQRAHVGLRIGNLRRERGLTQEALAERAGISKVTVAKIEQQDRSPSLSVLEKLADALGVPAGEIIDSLAPRPRETGKSDSVAELEKAGPPEPSFGEELKRLMEERAVGVHELARRTDYSPGYISNLRTGTKAPSPMVARKVDSALDAEGQLIETERRVARERKPQPRRKRQILRIQSESGPEPTAIDSPEPGPDTIVLNLRLDGKEVAVPISRLLLLRAGVSSFVEAFALDQQFDMIHDITQRPRRAERLTIASPAHLQEILIHLREQWHSLVKTDNLLGPRFALAGVLNQISVVEALRSILRDEQRIEVARLGAKYAESAAWLYEETDNMTQARFWTSQAMEWAYEGNDERMLAWTIFRRAQQAAAIPDAAQTIGLAQAARRNEEKLATPTRAAIRVQEAYGHALDGNDQAAQRLLDEAHTWAAGDTVGDAREGHGSYCIPDYIEIQRATCWLATGQPKKAISLYEDSLRTLPTVYQGNRAATLTRLAVAYAADSQPEQAATTAHAALPVARNAGSRRIVGEIKNVGSELIPYRALPAVAALLDELEAEDHRHGEPDARPFLDDR